LIEPQIFWNVIYVNLINQIRSQTLAKLAIVNEKANNSLLIKKGKEEVLDFQSSL